MWNSILAKKNKEHPCLPQCDVCVQLKPLSVMRSLNPQKSDQHNESLLSLLFIYCCIVLLVVVLVEMNLWPKIICITWLRSMAKKLWNWDSSRNASWSWTHEELLRLLDKHLKHFWGSNFKFSTCPTIQLAIPFSNNRSAFGRVS